MNVITFNLNPTSTTPLYEQIYSFIKEEIQTGNLTFNTKLPSTRSLSSHLQVSRNTIDMAYSQLLSEGYIESYPKKGYFVCQINNIIQVGSHSADAKDSDIDNKPIYKYDFSPSNVDLSAFPYNTWRKLMRNSLSYDNSELFKSGNHQGDLSLRSSIKSYLHHSRGVHCDIKQIIIGAGADYLLMLLARILSNNVNFIAMENPTYIQAYRILKGFNYNIVPIGVDSGGINIGELYDSNANIAYVTPSHQYPLGFVMPIKRRLKLLTWANENDDRYIIEDDHDSEFRYKGKPIPALAGIDSNDKIIYMGTFSRAIAPAIRIGYMVLPKKLMSIYESEYSYYSCTVSRIDQYILTNFIDGGYFERHLNKMRQVYKSKHDKLISLLKPHSDIITILSESAGLHIVIKVTTVLDELKLIEMSKKADIKIYGLSDYYITKPTVIDYPILILGYASLSEKTIEEGINKLLKVLK